MLMKIQARRGGSDVGQGVARAAGYVRRSTEMQEERLEEQKAELQRYAEAQGIASS
jgi:hypothetical protein